MVQFFFDSRCITVSLKCRVNAVVHKVARGESLQTVAARQHPTPEASPSTDQMAIVRYGGTAGRV